MQSSLIKCPLKKPTKTLINIYLCHIHRKPFTIYEEQNEIIVLTHPSPPNDSGDQNMEIDEINEYDISDNDTEYNINCGDHNRNRGREEKLLSIFHHH